MTFDFDEEIDRTGTASVKYEGAAAQFGSTDLIPLWVADMDFRAPDAVVAALAHRAQHALFGYTFYPESLTTALIEWWSRRHGWAIEPHWVVYSPGAVTALHAAILAATLPGDKVIVQSPVYHPFFSAVTTTGRVLVENPLRFDQGRYTMDLDHLEQLAASGARHLILCSPHNPVGRVWQVSELAGVLDIARRYQMTIVSDELHADLVYPGIRHTPLARLATVDDRLITIVAPSKTFNIPGLGLSAMIVPDRDRRRALQGVFHQLHVQATNPFSIVAFEAAYRDGEPWLLSLLNYLTGTRDLVRAYLEEHLPEIKWVEPEGTYLLWLDCRALHMNDRALQDFMVKDAHVGLSPGIQFGQPGSGFMRMNIGAPRKTILQALAQIHTAWAARA